MDQAWKNTTPDGKGVTIYFGNPVWVYDTYNIRKTYTIQKINGVRRITAVTQTGGCTSCGGDGVRYVYDTQRRVIEKELANGRIDKYQDFDSQSRYQTEIQASGTSNQRTFHYTYHPVLGSHLSVSEDSVLGTGSKQTIYDYDNDANTVPNENPTNLVYRQIEKGFTKDQSSAVVPYESITSFTYNANGQVLTIDGPKPGDQDKVTYAYYQNGDLLSITQPLIGTTTYDQYDAAGLVGRVIDPNGLAVTMTYDARGRIKTRTTEANNAVVTYNYNTAGDIASVTDAMGVTLTYTYEPTYGRLDKITDPIGNYLKYSYDDKGNRQEQGYYTPSNIRTYQMRYNYQHPNQPGKLWKVINPDNTYTEYSYDNTGNIASIKDPDNKISTYQYDLFNRIKNVIQPGNVLTTYAYDSQDHLILVTDAKNNVTAYAYDDLGRVLSVTSPDTNTVTYVYDEANNLISMLDAKNQETRFTYDVLNRVLTKRYYMNGTPASPDGLVTYTYDQGPHAKGKLTLVTDSSSSQAYEYDELGRLELETKTINGISFQILYGYNKNNELETMTYPSGRVVSYNKNSAGQINEVSTSYENNLTPLVQNITRLPFGPVIDLNLGNGLEQVQTFDQLYRLTSSRTGTIYNRSHTYNPNNNITGIQDLVTPTKNQTFGYDDLNRLTNAAGSYGNIGYTYDAVGNRLTRTQGTQVESYTYQTNNNRLNSISGSDPISYTYDSNGNITGLGPKTLNYTPDNRLLEVQPLTPVTDNLKSEYVYNHQGQRVQKKVYKYIAANWQPETENLFIYDIQGNLIMETDGFGNVLKEYAYLEGNRLAQFSHDLPTQLAIEVVTNGNHLLANVRVYAFTAEGHYTGIYAVTDAEGRAAFELKDLPPGQYKFRVDYLSAQFWTPVLTVPGTTHYQLVIAEETATVTVEVAGIPWAGVKVYLFNEQGTYLGLYQVTDDQGQVSFDLPVGYTFKFRADTLGSQYWSPATTIITGTNNIALVNAGGGILTLTLEKDPSTPLPGLKTYIFNTTGTYLGLTATSDANGQAAFSLSQGQYKIRIDYLGYQLWSDPINVNQNTSQVLTIPHQDVGIQVSGDYDNTPVPKPGLKAYLFNPANTYIGLSQVTDSQGQVTFNLPQQDYKVRVDYLTQSYWTNAFNWQNRTITIPEGQAQVIVTRLDQPLKDIKVYAFNAQGTYLGLTQTSDDQGQASFKLPEGQYKFRADYLGNQYWSDLSTIIAHTINPIALSTGGGHFTLTVNKDENIALPGLKCYLFNASGTYLGQQANTNDQGQVSFNPSNGNYKIRVDYLGYQYWSDLFNIPTVTELTLTIPHRAVSIQANTRYNSQIEPLAGVKTYLFLPDNTYQGLSQTTDAAGKALLNLPQQEYKVRVDYLGQQYWSANFNWTDPSVTIPEGLAEVHLSQQGAPIPNASVYLFSGAGTYLGITAKTDSLGLLSFQVPAGTYKFRADYQGNQYWATAGIQADQVNVIYLNTGGGTFTLSVLKSEDQPLANTPVYAFTSSGSYLNLNGQTNAQGQVVFSLSNGQYKFRVDYLGYQFWSNVEIVPDNLSDILLIPHRQVTLTVNENFQQDKEPLQNVRVYLFKASGSYMSIYANTNDQGQVSFEVPQQAYKVRADYMGYQFWSEPFVWLNKEVDIEHGRALVHVTQGGQNIANAKVYLFKPTGTYLSQYQTTDPNGLSRFLLPNQAYKFRVDYNGKQYWTGEVTIIAHEENGIEVNIDQLVLDETNNPNPTRFDGFPPIYRKEDIKVATAGSLVGLLAQTQANLGDSNPGIVYYYVNDHLGTPQLMADQEGQVVWRADYDPFGAASVDPGSSTVNQHRFPGQYQDEETQLHYNYFRDYDPRSGRYLTPDPIGQAGGINLYPYVENNPTNEIDPYGLFDMNARGSAQSGRWTYVFTFYSTRFRTITREFGYIWKKPFRYFVKVLDYMGGKETGVSDEKHLKDRWKCDRGDKRAKEIYEEMFGDKNISDDEFMDFMERLLNEKPELDQFYDDPDIMLIKAKMRGRRVPQL